MRSFILVLIYFAFQFQSSQSLGSISSYCSDITDNSIHVLNPDGSEGPRANVDPESSPFYEPCPGGCSEENETTHKTTTTPCSVKTKDKKGNATACNGKKSESWNTTCSSGCKNSGTTIGHLVMTYCVPNGGVCSFGDPEHSKTGVCLQ